MSYWPGTRVSKYGAVRTEVDGIKFASKREAKRYQELKLLERAGKIRTLELQKRYPLHVKQELICTYVADFYYTTIDGYVVEDAKGFKTPEYKIKTKLMKAIYGIEIREV